jgi:RHS repeat-associated protein
MLQTSNPQLSAISQVAESKGDRSKSRFIHRRRVRLYDPQTGRFMNQDPLGLRGGLNLYAYASNNPIVMLDPDGNCALSAVLNLSIFGIIVDSLFPIETAPSSFDDVPGIPIIYEPGFNPLPGGGVPPGGYGTYVQNGDGDDTDS